MCTSSSEWTPLLRLHASRLRQWALKHRKSLRVLRHQRRKRRMASREAMKKKMVGGKKAETLEMQNLKLFMKNQSIIQENELLREKALLLHHENTALLLLLRNKFSAEQKDDRTN